VFVALFGACANRGCGGCNSDAIATLVEHHGEVQRDRAASTGHFERAEDRASFLSGDALRTLAGSTARLQLPASGSVLVQSDTTIRLWRGARKALRLNVQTGLASVLAAKDALEIQTELGIAVLQAGSQLRVKPAHKGQRYEVTMGRAVLTTHDGKQLNLGPGEAIGADVAVEPAPAPAPAPAIAENAPGEAETGLGGEGELQLAPGLSAAIYDPNPPTAVRFDVPASCEGVVVTLRGHKPLPLTAADALRLGPGLHEYQLACTGANPQTWRGALRVLKNPGTAQLPRSAPHNSIELDGRTYTILFQNLMPVLEVRWANAPSAASYELIAQLESGRELKLSERAPVHVFAAGALPEGRHQLQFQAAGGAQKSRLTTIDLRFDNASPSASLKSPPVSGFAPGSSVHVAGIALPGAQVSVLGERFSLDAQQRFTGDVPLPPGTKAIAVRIQHPRTGTRYYVRRARTSP
jgi:hypothetical protein